MDSKFRVEVLSQTDFPQMLTYWAMHQDYSEEYVFEECADKMYKEDRCGDIAVNRLLKGGRGHFGPLEHASLTVNAGYFPHSTMQQLRTHRVGVSFDVQSFRYTGQRIVDVANHERHIEEVIYIRPPGDYTDRKGNKYHYSAVERSADIEYAFEACVLYANKINRGFSEEHARGLIPFDVRQHFVMTGNIRSWMHLLDMRWKADAQLECQWFCDLLWEVFKNWVPEIAAWYEESRAKRARLAP